MIILITFPPIPEATQGLGWVTFVTANDNSTTLQLNVFALCFDNPPIGP